MASARRQARLSRGERQFIWKARVLPIGLPIGIVLGALSWYVGDEDDADEIAPGLARFAIAFSTAVGASWLGAKLEWELQVARWEDPRID